MLSNTRQILQSIAAASMMIAVGATAQAPAAAPETAPPSAPAAQAPAPAPPAATAASPTWSVGPMDVSGFVDVYYSYNQNRPAAATATGQVNQLYNFNDMTDQFNLSALKLTLNHDPDPVARACRFRLWAH